MQLQKVAQLGFALVCFFGKAQKPSTQFRPVFVRVSPVFLIVRPVFVRVHYILLIVHRVLPWKHCALFVLFGKNEMGALQTSREHGNTRQAQKQHKNAHGEALGLFAISWYGLKKRRKEASLKSFFRRQKKFL